MAFNIGGGSTACISRPASRMTEARTMPQELLPRSKRDNSDSVRPALIEAPTLDGQSLNILYSSDA